MQKNKAGIPAFSELSTREKVLLCACAVLLVVLIASICISINMRVNMQRDYASVRGKLGESLYSNLAMLAQTFDMTSVPNADIRNVILPQMRNYFAASTTLNDALAKCYGQRYRLLTEADVSSINTAFNAYEAAFRSESSTDLARADMQTCMTRVRELLSSRFNEGVLKAGR